MIFLGADHRGFHLKEKIRIWLYQWGLEFEDLGNDKLDPADDYPEFALKVAKKVSDHEQEAVGIVICGSGVGVDVVANKFPKIRCGLGFSAQQIRMARQDDDINVLALPADFLSYKKAQKIVEMFLKTEFDNKPEHRKRLEEIRKLYKHIKT
jgi:RpiB/LacA/LacB family sugar-phosphate isomerase